MSLHIIKKTSSLAETEVVLEIVSAMAMNPVMLDFLIIGLSIHLLDFFQNSFKLPSYVLVRIWHGTI